MDCLECKKTIVSPTKFRARLCRDCAIKLGKCQHCAVKDIYPNTVLCKLCIYKIYDTCPICNGPSIERVCIDHKHKH